MSLSLVLDRAQILLRRAARPFLLCSNIPWICLFIVLCASIVAHTLPFYCVSYGMEVSYQSCGYLNTDGGQLQLVESMTSVEFRAALLLSVVLATPMVVDAILDCLDPMLNEDERVLWYTNVTTLILITGPNLILLSGFYGNYAAQEYLLSISNIRTAISGCTFAYAAQVALKDGGMKHAVRCLGLTMICFGASFLRSYGHTTDPMTHRCIDRISFVVRGSGFVMFVHVLRQWCRELHPSGNEITVSEMRIIVKILAVVLYSCGLGIATSLYRKKEDQGPSLQLLCSYLYLQMFYTIMAISISGRIANVERRYLSRVLTNKQAFIRYISHEIRTPLNTVFLGLEHATAALNRIPQQNGGESVLAIVDTLGEVHTSCVLLLCMLCVWSIFDEISVLLNPLIQLIATVTLPPVGVNFNALLIKFRIT